jgi:endonuclease YncB( thermonuclease family)
MTTPQRGKWSYTTAGLKTMGREIILSIPALFGLIPETMEDIMTFMGSPLHLAGTIIRQTERATNLSCVLINQCAYSMILQVGEEMDREMEVQIPNMAKTLSIFETILPFYSTINPLGGIAFVDRLYAYKSNMASYQAVLDHWNDSWERLTTTVTEVTDGDTIHVAAFPDPIRIQGIDCPEICHTEWDPDCSPDEKRFEAGYAAKEYAEGLLLNKTVYLRAMKHRDYYGRVLAKVRIGEEDGPIFAHEMVRAGHAKFYTWSFPTTLSH